ncbi:substrate-binding periplasmic protein [Pseudomonas abietaniphila]|uniref:substrate-binding periplasmic protein n=1 Tax=Pseudomonas abietaniphila TaxID=89065 RepID=UPI000B0F13DE|nr:transporter substrate-binding domain-containing protein [Pseudomonas abietaniphila]
MATMKINSKRLALSVVLTVTASQVVAADCVPAHTFETLTPHVLTVAAWSFPPYSIPGAGTKLSGVDGEIIKRIAEKECLTIKTTALDPAAVIQSVVAKRADVGIGDWYRTAERNKILGLTAPIYLDVMGIISKDGVTKVADLEGKRVGTVQGYLWVPDLQKVFGDNLVLYPNPVAMAQDLASNRLDAGADSYAVAIAAQQKGGFSGYKITVSEPDSRVKASLEPGQTAFAYTKGNAALGEALSADIDAMHKSGEIKKILKSFGLSEDASEVGTPRLVE